MTRISSSHLEQTQHRAPAQQQLTREQQSPLCCFDETQNEHSEPDRAGDQCGTATARVDYTYVPHIQSRRAAKDDSTSANTSCGEATLEALDNSFGLSYLNRPLAALTSGKSLAENLAAVLAVAGVAPAEGATLLAGGSPDGAARTAAAAGAAAGGWPELLQLVVLSS